MAYYPNAITYGDNGAVDANTRLRVVIPETIYSSNFIYGTCSCEWSTRVGSIGSNVSHLPNEAACLLTVGTASLDECTLQTKLYSRVVTGKSYTFLMSFLFGTPITNLSRSIGFFDDNNGYYIEQSGNGNINIVQRLKTSGIVVNNVISQSNWNKDKMDGSGVSGKTLDFTKIQTINFDSFWPSGRVRCGFRIDGMRYTAHEFYCANYLDTPNITAPQLPMRSIIYNSAASSGGTMKLYHVSGRIEGGIQEDGRFFCSGSNGQITVTTRRPICSLRPKQLYNGFVNRGQILIKDIQIHTATNSCYWELVYGGTLANASWKDVHTNSFAEFDLVANGISGGMIIASGFSAASATNQNIIKNVMTTTLQDREPLCLNDVSGSDNSGIIVSLVCTSFTGDSLNVGSINWQEFR